MATVYTGVTVQFYLPEKSANRRSGSQYLLEELTRYTVDGVNMGELENILPNELKKVAASSGEELVLPYVVALAAIAVASNHQIAILGIEAFEIRKDGLRTVNYSDLSASVPFTGTWRAYVEDMNAESERWLTEHPLGENHGYILTSASERELADAKAQIR